MVKQIFEECMEQMNWISLKRYELVDVSLRVEREGLLMRGLT
jgi:hypothetical protein